MTVQLTPPNSVSIFWLLPQITVMVVAEILFAVTQMTFSFTEVIFRFYLISFYTDHFTLGSNTIEICNASNIASYHCVR